MFLFSPRCVHLVGGGAIANFSKTVIHAYENATSAGLWNNTYAAKNYME